MPLTLEDLEALPAGARIHDPDGEPWERTDFGIRTVVAAKVLPEAFSWRIDLAHHRFGPFVHPTEAARRVPA